MALFVPKPKIKNKKIQFLIIIFSINLLLTSAATSFLSDLDTSLTSSSIGPDSISELEGLKFKISILEATLEEYKYELNSKTLLLEENYKLIEELEKKSQLLQRSLSNVQTSVSAPSDSETMVAALEEEVRLLWAKSRKENFDYHVLESKVNEDENKVEEVSSVVAKMEDIVNEQWIQIRQLEQSLQMMKIMSSKAQKSASKPKGFTLLKFIKVIGHHPDGADLPDSFFLGDYVSKSRMTRAFRQLKRTWSTVKRWHFELQNSVRWALEMNEFTAPLAHPEAVFFLASAVVVIPMLSVWAIFS